MPDTRIVHGARCTWWDSIDKISTIPFRAGEPGLPCCPHCRSPLFELESIEEWNDGVKKYDAAHPGYADFVAWQRGRCFQTLAVAKAAYLKEEGRTFA